MISGNGRLQGFQLAGNVIDVAYRTISNKHRCTAIVVTLVSFADSDCSLLRAYT